MDIFFVDSGVIWRLLDPLHPEREPCLTVARRCFSPKPDFLLGVNSVVIVEAIISLVKRSKMTPSAASSIIYEGFLKAKSRVIVYAVTRETILEALRLYRESGDAEFPDCVIAATMKENNISTILTTNPKHFKSFSFVKEAIDPRSTPI